VYTLVDASLTLRLHAAKSSVVRCMDGYALHEATHMDARYGRYVNANLGEYHVPVNAIPNMIVEFVPEEDRYVNAMGVKGIGEIAMVGVAAAVANAIYHATGKRIRDLPITPDKLL